MFSDNLKRLRQAAGLTQAAFAAKAKVPLRNVQNWEQGHREPRLDVVAELAKILGVTTDDLITGEGRSKPTRGRPRKGK